jgi:hypothetical protein
MTYFKVLSRNFLGGTEKCHETFRMVGNLVGIQTACLWNSCLERYHYANLLISQVLLVNSACISPVILFDYLYIYRLSI